jgi:hypothetical protein
MEADLHAIVSLLAIGGGETSDEADSIFVPRLDSFGSTAVGRSLPELHLSDSLRTEGASGSTASFVERGRS